MKPKELRLEPVMPDSAAVPANDDMLGCEIDLVHLSRQSMGDKDLEVELLSLFARQARSIMRDLSAPLAVMSESAPTRESGTLLHTLCGSARVVGSWGVAAQAQSLEQDYREQPAPPTDAGARTQRMARLTALCESVERACASIDHLLDAAE